MDDFKDPSAQLFRLNNGAALDQVDIRLFHLLKETVAFNKDSRAYQERLISEIRGALGDAKGLPDIVAIQHAFERLESELAERLGTRSILFWLTVFRTVLGMNDGSGFSDMRDLIRQRRLIETAILKFGSALIADVVVAGSLWEANAEAEDIATILDVCVLAGLASQLHVDRRRVALGGVIKLTENEWSVDFPEREERHVAIYSKRLGRFENIFQFAGIPGERFLNEGSGEFWTAIASQNHTNVHWHGREKAFIEAIDSSASFVGPDDSYLPQYLVALFSLESLRPWLELMRDTYHEQFGFLPISALCLIREAARMGFEAYITDFRLGHRIRSTALIVLPVDTLINQAARSAAELGVTSPVAEATAAFEFLAPEAANKDELVLGTSAGSRQMTRFKNDIVVVDFLGAFGAVRRLLAPMGLAEGQPANDRSHAFEEFAREQLLLSIDGASLWLFSTRIRFADGKYRDVDVGIIIGDTLFLAECKAFGRRIADEIPSIERLQRRAETLNAAVDQVMSLAEKLSRVPVNGDNKLPSSVRYIAPCVLTIGVEWCSDESPRAWLVAGETPRVCTVGEAIAVAKQLRHGPLAGAIDVLLDIP